MLLRSALATIPSLKQSQRTNQNNSTAQSLEEDGLKFVDLVNEATQHRHHLLLWPVRWKLYNQSLSLNWCTFPFEAAAASSIPKEPGVYGFIIDPSIASNLDCSHLMYIGKTDRPLRERFREYLREAKSPLGRPKILMLLNLYAGHLLFTCSTVTAPATPSDVERELLKALMPPANDRLPAEVGKIVAAFM